MGRSWADVGRFWADVIVFADHFTLHASDVVASSEDNDFDHASRWILRSLVAGVR